MLSQKEVREDFNWFKDLGIRGSIAYFLNRISKRIYEDNLYQKMIFPNGAELFAIGSKFGYGIMSLMGNPLEDESFEWDWIDYTPEEFDKYLDEK